MKLHLKCTKIKISLDLVRRKIKQTVKEIKQITKKKNLFQSFSKDYQSNKTKNKTP
jgi:hypothetical protein